MKVYMVTMYAARRRGPLAFQHHKNDRSQQRDDIYDRSMAGIAEVDASAVPALAQTRGSYNQWLEPVRSLASGPSQ